MNGHSVGRRKAEKTPREAREGTILTAVYRKQRFDQFTWRRLSRGQFLGQTRLVIGAWHRFRHQTIETAREVRCLVFDKVEAAVDSGSCKNSFPIEQVRAGFHPKCGAA